MKKVTIIIVVILIIIIAFVVIRSSSSDTPSSEYSSATSDISDTDSTQMTDESNGDTTTNLTNSSMSTSLQPDFLEYVYGNSCYNTDKQVSDLTFSGQSATMSESGWKAKLSEIDQKLGGTYTTDPAWAKYTDKDFSALVKNGKVKVVKLQDISSLGVLKVAAHVSNTYSGDYMIPGVEFWQWLWKNQDQIPAVLGEDGTNDFASHEYYFFGSSMGTCDGEWGVPSIRIVIGVQRRNNGDSRYKFNVHGGQGPQWTTSDHVVLIEK